MKALSRTVAHCSQSTCSGSRLQTPKQLQIHGGQVTVQRFMCKQTVWGDDMCYFECKFFSDSPPSEPAESDSDASLKTEVCFYD